MRAQEALPFNITSPVQHKTLDQEGYSIHYFVSGSNASECVVFLHPAFADHRCFDKQIDYFARDYRVIALDLLGHGLSRVGKSRDKIDSSVNHIDSILTLEGCDKAHFVGVSMGTLIAQYYALKHPERIASMTILGGYDINANNREIVRAQRAEIIKWILKALFSMDSFRRYVATVSVSHSEEQTRFFQMAGLFTRKSFVVMSGLGKILQLRETEKRDYPLLILSGDEDLELARRMSKKWHESEPSSNYYLIEKAGHCANMDNAEEFNRIVMSFIQGKE